jgi:hypothetical protein
MGSFWIFSFYVQYSTLLHLPPSDSTVSEAAGIEPRTVATTALTVRRSIPTAIDLMDENIPIIAQVGVLQRYASMHVGSPWLDTGWRPWARFTLFYQI